MPVPLHFEQLQDEVEICWLEGMVRSWSGFKSLPDRPQKHLESPITHMQHIQNVLMPNSFNIKQSKVKVFVHLRVNLNRIESRDIVICVICSIHHFHPHPAEQRTRLYVFIPFIPDVY